MQEAQQSVQKIRKQREEMDKDLSQKVSTIKKLLLYLPSVLNKGYFASWDIIF